MKKAHKILSFLEKNKETLSPLLILTHNFPDPDALASAFALKYIVENFYNIQSKIVYGGVIGRTENRSMVDILSIPINKLTSSDFKEYSSYALVDTQPFFQNNSFPQDKHASIVIDQHKATKKPKADLVIIDPKCGATCVLITEALLLHTNELPKELATAISYGIISETLNLYRGTTRRVIKTYLSILPKADITALAQIQNPTRSKNFFKSLSVGIQNCIVCESLIASHLGFVENPDLVSQTADFLLSYKDIEWCVCTGRYKGSLYVSLRSRVADATSGDILREVVGDESRAGGHGGIAGGSIVIGENASEDTWREAENMLFGQLSDKLKISANSCLLYPFRTQETDLRKEVFKS